MYLTIGPKTRYNPLVGIYNREAFLVTEIAYPPLGYVLTINQTEDFIEPLTNITDIVNCLPNREYLFSSLVTKVPTYSYLSLDYRTKTEVDECVRNSINENE